MKLAFCTRAPIFGGKFEIGATSGRECGSGGAMSRIAIRLMSCLLISNLALAAEDGAMTAPGPEQSSSVDRASAFAPRELTARGPGARFASVEEAAVDALTYAYLQARVACDPEFMRGGTIHPVADGYFSYGATYRAKPLSLHRIEYPLKPRDVARFHLYPVHRDPSINRENERASRVDRRSVSVVDPLHRPLFILHPSLRIRVYRGEGPQAAEVANLRRPARPTRVAAKCSEGAPSLAGRSDPHRVAETSPPLPRY
jgi:hypothetical protein